MAAIWFTASWMSPKPMDWADDQPAYSYAAAFAAFAARAMARFATRAECAGLRDGLR